MHIPCDDGELVHTGGKGTHEVDRLGKDGMPGVDLLGDEDELHAIARATRV